MIYSIQTEVSQLSKPHKNIQSLVERAEDASPSKEDEMGHRHLSQKKRQDHGRAEGTQGLG